MLIQGMNLYNTTQVFLDEVNTSSCLGLFKEIIIDRSFSGEVMLLTTIRKVYNGYVILCAGYS